MQGHIYKKDLFFNFTKLKCHLHLYFEFPFVLKSNIIVACLLRVSDQLASLTFEFYGLESEEWNLNCFGFMMDLIRLILTIWRSRDSLTSDSSSCQGSFISVMRPGPVEDMRLIMSPISRSGTILNNDT